MTTAPTSAPKNAASLVAAQCYPLTPDNLSAISKTVAVPTYDLGDRRRAIVHFGPGGFHRAHQAAYIDRLMTAGIGLDWGITEVNVRHPGDELAPLVNAQSGLYTLVEKSTDGVHHPRVVGSVIEYVWGGAENAEKVIELLASEETRVVTLTVTEGGYYIDRVTGCLDLDNAEITHDINARGNGPVTVFGMMIEALRRRRDRDILPFTIVSCDNIQGNGLVVRSVMLALCNAFDPEFAGWMEEHVAFPSSMVDRITPMPTDGLRRQLREQYGIDDAWPIASETFTQWVVEDCFTAGRPALEAVGVQLVSDVHPYEIMKLRLLNAGHLGLAHFGALLGYRYVHEAARDFDLAEFLLAYMREEAIPTLHEVPGIDLVEYTQTLIDRFRNGEIADTIQRLMDGTSDRLTKFLLPAVRDHIDFLCDVNFARCAAMCAAWCMTLRGRDENGNVLEEKDSLIATLRQAAHDSARDPAVFLQTEKVFGDLSGNSDFVDAFSRALESMTSLGVRRTLRSLH